MAEQLESPFRNFSISDTVEMGKAQLVEDFLSPESATTKPEEVEKIVAPKKEEKKDKTPEDKEAILKAKQEAEKAKQDALDNLLGKDESEEEEELEEEEKPAKIVKKKEETPKEESEAEEVNTFSSLSKELFNQGVFLKGEDEGEIEITTPEQFLERFQFEKQRGAEQMVLDFIGRHGEDYQNAFHAIFENGVDPKEYFGIYNNIQSFVELDLKLESNQELVIKQGLKDQGFEPEDITVKLEKIKNYGDLEDEAQRFHKVLIKKETQKLAQVTQDKEKQLQQQLAVKQQYVNTVNSVLQEKLKTKEFDGIPLNPKLAQELQDYLLKDKYRTPSGELLTDFDKAILDLKKPENHQQKVKLALILKVLEKDPTLSTIQKSGITKETNKLFGDLVVKKDKSAVKNGKSTSDVFTNL